MTSGEGRDPSLGSSPSFDSLLHCNKVLSCQKKKKKNTVSLNLTHVIEFSREGSQPILPGSSPNLDNLLHCSKVLSCKKKNNRFIKPNSCDRVFKRGVPTQAPRFESQIGQFTTL